MLDYSVLKLKVRTCGENENILNESGQLDQRHDVTAYTSLREFKFEQINEDPLLQAMVQINHWSVPVYNVLQYSSNSVMVHYFF